MRSGKKLFAGLLSAIMLLSSVGSPVFAAGEDIVSTGVEQEYSDDGFGIFVDEAESAADAGGEAGAEKFFVDEAEAIDEVSEDPGADAVVVDLTGGDEESPAESIVEPEIAPVQEEAPSQEKSDISKQEGVMLDFADESEEPIHDRSGEEAASFTEEDEELMLDFEDEANVVEVIDEDGEVMSLDGMRTLSSGTYTIKVTHTHIGNTTDGGACYKAEQTKTVCGGTWKRTGGSRSPGYSTPYVDVEYYCDKCGERNWWLSITDHTGDKHNDEVVTTTYTPNCGYSTGTILTFTVKVENGTATVSPASGDAVKANGSSLAKNTFTVTYAPNTAVNGLVYKLKSVKRTGNIGGESGQTKDITSTNPNKYTFQVAANTSKTAGLEVVYGFDDTVFATGKKVRDAIKSLSGYLNAKNAVWSSSAPASGVSKVTVSAEGSANPIYAWIDGENLKFYSAARSGNKPVYLNPDSASFFDGINGLVDVRDFTKNVDSSKVTNLYCFFYTYTSDSSSKLQFVDVANWNTSNVKNMSWCFGRCPIKDIDLSGWDTRNVETMDRAFVPGSGVYNSITLGPNWRWKNTNESGTPVSPGFMGFWYKDGTTKTYETQGASTSIKGFESFYNSDPAANAGTWLQGEPQGHYWLNKNGTVGGGMVEIHHPNDYYPSYCSGNHFSGGRGVYEKFELNTVQQLKEFTAPQTPGYKPFADNAVDAYKTALYYGYPNDPLGLQVKHGLTDKEFQQVTQRLIWFLESGNERTATTYDFKNARDGGSSYYKGYSDELCERMQACYEDFVNNARFSRIPNRDKIQLWGYLSISGFQNQVSIEGLNFNSYGGVQVLKQDTDGEPVQGAVFTVYDKNNKAVATMTSGSDGYAFLCRFDESQGLLVGQEYTVKETQAPDGYTLSTDVFKFTVASANTVTETGFRNSSTQKEKMVFVDEPTRTGGGIRMRKVSTTDNSMGLPLATYGIFQNGKLITTMTTDENGYAETGPRVLAAGTYTLKELDPPTGFHLSDEEKTFTIPDTNGYLEGRITMADPPKTGTVEIPAKKVVPGYKMRPGYFTFHLLDAVTGEKVAEAKNDANGDILFKVSYSSDKDFGNRSYKIVEVPGKNNRYVYDNHEEYVIVMIEDNGGSELDCYTDFETEGGAVFTNEFVEPNPTPAPIKKVSGGKILEEDVKNQVYYTHHFTYTIDQKIPDQVADNYYDSFVLTDSAAYKTVGGEVDGSEPGGIKINSVSVSNGNADVTDQFKITISSSETEDPEDAMYTFKAEYIGNLNDPAFYNKTYTFTVDAQAAQDVFESKTYHNNAVSKFSFADDENEDLTLNTNDVSTIVLPFVYLDEEMPERSDVTVVKHVYDAEGNNIDLQNVSVGDVLTYVITARNTLKKASVGVSFEDALPEHTEFVSASDGGSYSDGKVQWSGLSMEAGQSVSVSFDVKVLDEDVTIDNTAVMTATPLNNPENPSVTLSTNTTHNYVPSIKKFVTDESGNNIHGTNVYEGSNLYYHLFVKNPDSEGNVPSRSGVHTMTVKDLVPEGTKLVAVAKAGVDADNIPNLAAPSISVKPEMIDAEGETVEWTQEFKPGEIKVFTFMVQTTADAIEFVNSGSVKVQNGADPVGSVLVEHRDADTYQILKSLAYVKKNAPVGTAYQTARESFEGYHFVKMDPASAPAAGSVKEEDQRVIYLYSKETQEVGRAPLGSVAVIHKDRATGEILKDLEYVICEKPVGTPYETAPENIARYHYVEMEEGSAPAEGSAEIGLQTVIYLYDKDEEKEPDYLSNEVENGVPMDPVKRVLTLEDEDVNKQVLQVGDEYKYTITVSNPTDYEKTYVITDEIPEEIEVISIANGVNQNSDYADEPEYTFEDGVITWVSQMMPGDVRTFAYMFKPNAPETHFTNIAHVSIIQQYIDPETEEPVQDSELVVWEKDTNEVENWTIPDPVKSVSREAQNMHEALVWAENEDVLTYRIDFKNTTALKKHFTIIDELDEDLTFVSASDNGTYNEETRTVTIEMDLEPESEGFVTFDAKVSCGNVIASANNHATVCVDEAYPDTNQTDTDIDETPTKTVTDAAGQNINMFLVNKDDELTYTIRVKNPDELMKHFVVKDIVPENSELVNAVKGEMESVFGENTATEGGESKVSVSDDQRFIIWEADIPSGQQWKFVFTVKANKKDSYIPNEAEVTVDGSSIKTNLVENWVPEDPMKAVVDGDKDINGKTFFVEDQSEITYKITVHNPASVEKEFTIVDKLDDNLKFVSADNNGAAQGQVVTWKVNVPKEGSKVVSVKAKFVEAPSREKIPNSADVSCDNFKYTTNTVVNYITYRPVKSVLDMKDQDLNGKMIFTNNNYKYTIKFKNPTEETKTFTVTDTLEDGQIFVSADNNGTSDGKVVTWKGLTLEAGKEMTVSMTVKAPDSLKNKEVKNHAHVICSDKEILYSSDTNEVHLYFSQVEKHVQTLERKDTNGSVEKVGNELIYAIRVANPSKEDQTVTIEDTLPAGLTFVSASDGGNASGSAVKFENVKVPAGGHDYTIQVKITDSLKDKSFTNTAILSAHETKEKTNEVINFVLNDPVKTVTADGKDADNVTVEAGKLLTFQIKFHNPANAEKTFTITDKVDEKLKVQKIENGGNLGSGNVITWKVKVVANADAVVSFTAKAPEAESESSVKNKADVSVDHASLPTNEVTVNVARAPQVVTTPISKLQDAIAYTNVRITGDASNMAFWIILLIAAIGAGVGITIYAKKKR